MRSYDVNSAKVGDTVLFMNSEATVVYIGTKQLILHIGDDALVPVCKESGLLHEKPLAKLAGKDIYQGDTIYYGRTPYVVSHVEEEYVRYVNGAIENIFNGNISSAVCATFPFIIFRERKIPAPLQEAPKNYTKVYAPSLTSLSLHSRLIWIASCKWQASLLREGLLWSTPEGAVAYVNVLFEDN